MRIDTYTRVVLTVIALCLIVLTLTSSAVVSKVSAQTSLTCMGELKANAWGGVEATIGGYAIEVKCQ